MKLSKELTTVTSFSKLMALLLFILLPLVGFYLGLRYGNPQQYPPLIPKLRPTTAHEKACTLEAMICPDGSSVGRTGPNCEFAACPPLPSSTTTPSFMESSPNGQDNSPQP